MSADKILLPIIERMLKHMAVNWARQQGADAEALARFEARDAMRARYAPPPDGDEP